MTSHPPRAFRVRIAIRDIEPSIWRRIEVPASFSLEELHTAIQIAFGWTDSHLFAFQIGRHRYEMSDDEMDAAALRRDSPLMAKIGDVFRKGTRATYEYDPGDDWVHDIVVEDEIRERLVRSVAVCTDGERAGPPEDCGGVNGYEEILESLHGSGLGDSGMLFDSEVFDRAAVNEALRELDVERGSVANGGDAVSSPVFRVA